MGLPFFYKEDITLNTTDVVLDEATSKHIVQVLRMKAGEQLQLTNGKGNLFTAEIKDDNRKKCAVTIIHKSEIKNPKSKISIAISLVKNNTRLEWFLEKATEIGVTEIIPLICERTEKTVFKFDRMRSILVSAMLQSQQTFLPVLHEPVKFGKLVTQPYDDTEKFIAHCENENNKVSLTSKLILSEAEGLNPSSSYPERNRSAKLILIGPEGDFTNEEITTALKNNFVPVALGETRLRTETAGIVAATLLCICTA